MNNGLRIFRLPRRHGIQVLLKKDKNDGTELFKTKLISSYRVFENIEIATLHHKSISDSIFMSSANDAYNFLCATKQVFLSFLENGLFVRGGIAYNKHFETNHITYSLALTDAYNIESEQSIFPRILIDKAVIQKLQNEAEPPQNNQTLQQIIENKLLINCGSHYQLHILDDTNWDNTFEKARDMYTTYQADIDESPKLTAYHSWFQEYLFNFKPARNRKLRYIKQFELTD